MVLGKMVPRKMICPKCFMEMEVGIAIDPKEERRYFTIAPEAKLKHPLKITEVYKCPKCGHSELMKDGKDVIY